MFSLKLNGMSAPKGGITQILLYHEEKGMRKANGWFVIFRNKFVCHFNHAMV